MALNCVMLTSKAQSHCPASSFHALKALLNGCRRKALLDACLVRFVQLSLQSMVDSSTTDKAKKPTVATGTAYITSQRFIFVSSTLAPSSSQANELRTLSVPLSHWQDGRLAQPLFAAIYYEALVRPVDDGGLSSYQQAKIIFKEGRSWEFVQAIGEVKGRHDEQQSAARRAAASEDLPTYTPRVGAPTEPSTPLLAVADVARTAEERERIQPSPSPLNPPAYEERT